MKKLLSILLIAGVALAVTLPTQTDAYVTTSIPCDYGSVKVCDRWQMLGDGYLQRWCHCEDEDSGHMTSPNWVETISIAP
jgi:hypothetical protein